MNKVVTQAGALAAACLILSCSEAQPSAGSGFVNAGRGAPVTPALPYPRGDNSGLTQFPSEYPVVGPFRLVLSGKSGGSDEIEQGMQPPQPREDDIFDFE